MQKLRVTIPRKKRDLIMLAQNLLSKHQLDAENSKLTVLDWGNFTSKIHQASIMHEEAATLTRKVREINEQRDLLLEDIESHLRNSRDVLTGVFKNEMKRLGEWGYTVMETSRYAKTQREMNVN